MLLVDTGPLVAAADTADTDHRVCKALLEDHPGPLVTSPMVIAEAAYLLDRQLGPRAEAALLASISDGSLRVAFLQDGDCVRIGEMVSTYADLRLGATDASLVALAERFGVTEVATLNRRHFTVVGPRHPTLSTYFLNPLRRIERQEAAMFLDAGKILTATPRS